MDERNNILSSSSRCVKSFCRVVFINKEKEKEEEVVSEKVTINPETGDNIYYFISFILITIIFGFIFKKRIKNLVLSNCFKFKNK